MHQARPVLIRSALPLALLLAAGAIPGCFVPGSTPGVADGTTEDAFRDRLGGTPSDDQPAGTADDGRPKITLRQIDAWTNAFADRWASYIQDATTRLIDADSTPAQRRAALNLKSASISSVYDIAVRNDPLTQLLDMVVLASLEQKVWVDEGLARQIFGDRAPILTKAIEDLYSDITLTSINAMNGEQYDLLNEAIRDWRESNPDIRAVEFVRLSEFAAARAADLRQQIRSSGLFAPIDEATRVADELKQLGQRGMWVGIRAPQLLSWQTEGLVDQILSRPEIAEALAGNESLVKSADRLSRTAAELPGLIQTEREAIFKGLDEREQRLGSTIREVKSSVEEGRKLLADTEPMLRNTEQVVRQVDAVVKSAQDLTKALTETVQAVDSVAARFAPPEPGRPAAAKQGEDFKIAEYTQAAQQLTAAVKELNTLVASAGNVVSSPAWRARVEEFDALGKRQIAEARTSAVSLADVVFWRALILLGAFFVGLSAWTWLRWKLK
jgi:methyl-accepting chemotaxis protein